MNELVSSIPLLNAAIASFTRIESFLKSDARKDHRLPLTNPHAHDDSSSVSPENGDIELKPLQSSVSKFSSSLILAQNATFAWSDGGKPAIRDLNFDLKRHQICFIIGPVGCGKSTLLKGLLGETPSSQGFVYSNSPDTAFVDQTSWVRNGTIQQNILGISAFEEPWYSQVVHACGLESDIAILPRGHGTSIYISRYPYGGSKTDSQSATPVGSAGISLSGGQKQRLALARALYARKELVVIDDVFSGLDASTEEHICASLLGKSGLFRQVSRFQRPQPQCLQSHWAHVFETRLPPSPKTRIQSVEGKTVLTCSIAGYNGDPGDTCCPETKLGGPHYCPRFYRTSCRTRIFPTSEKYWRLCPRSCFKTEKRKNGQGK